MLDVDTRMHPLTGCAYVGHTPFVLRLFYKCRYQNTSSFGGIFFALLHCKSAFSRRIIWRKYSVASGFVLFFLLWDWLNERRWNDAGHASCIVRLPMNKEL
jgi:hypothetical protein